MIQCIGWSDKMAYLTYSMHFEFFIAKNDHNILLIISKLFPLSGYRIFKSNRTQKLDLVFIFWMIVHRMSLHQFWARLINHFWRQSTPIRRYCSSLSTFGTIFSYSLEISEKFDYPFFAFLFEHQRSAGNQLKIKTFFFI